MSGFSNPIIGGGGGLVYPSIHSPDFSQGPPITGWSVDKNGDAFFSGTIGGTNFVITSAGIFLYNGTPAAGKLVISVLGGGAGSFGTDPYGNHTIGGGVACYSATEAILFAGGDTVIQTYTGSLSGGWSLGTASLSWAGLTWEISGGLTADTWHAVILDTGWTAGTPAPQYRTLPDGNVQLAGQATHASFSTETALNSSTPIPAAYRPASDKKFYAASRAGGLTGAALDTTGIIYAEPSGVSSTKADFTGITDLL